MKISVCISTWNRVNLLKLLIEKLEEQNFDRNEFEIIVADSNSNDGTNEYINEVKNVFHNIIYLKDINNNLSAKRNNAIKISKGKVIILLDDDVVPINQDFLNNHYNANILENNTFFSGQVRFPNDKIRQSNYFKFRDEQHYSDIQINNCIPYYRIVAMNMSFLNDNVHKISFFNELFLGYGCEDIDFGYRIEKNGFNNKYLREACVVHFEQSKNIEEYGKKIYMTAVYGKRNLLELNKEAFDSLKQTFVDKKNLFKDIVFNPIFENIVLKWLLLTDKYKILYCYLLYKYYTYCIYYRGFKNRNNEKRLVVDWIK